MRSFALLSTLFGASAALASPSVPVNSPTTDVFRFLGSVYCVVNSTTAAAHPNGPCEVASQIPLNFVGLTALTEVEGHAVNVTQRTDVFGPFAGYDVVSA
jgi:hypothetical protein